jgi:hypothetical protein
VGRTWHGGLLFQSEDYGQVAAMRFSLLPTATVTDGVMAASIASRMEFRTREKSGARSGDARCARAATANNRGHIWPTSGSLG